MLLSACRKACKKLIRKSHSKNKENGASLPWLGAFEQWVSTASNTMRPTPLNPNLANEHDVAESE